jgi:transcriptional regulator with XRE-family HTH domain
MRVNTKVVTELRKKASWSQDELATAAGLNLRTVQRIENVGTASLQSLKALASALEVGRWQFKQMILPSSDWGKSDSMVAILERVVE